MQKNKLGRRVCFEYGLISNVLYALSLVDQVNLSNVCSRTHDITVPWNIFCVLIPQDSPNFFPKIDAISDKFVCKRIKANIEGDEGHFYGSVCKATDYPDGYGVFKTCDWVQFGKVEQRNFTVGRKVSVNRKSKVLKLINIKR